MYNQTHFPVLQLWLPVLRPLMPFVLLCAMIIKQLSWMDRLPKYCFISLSPKGVFWSLFFATFSLHKLPLPRCFMHFYACRQIAKTYTISQLKIQSSQRPSHRIQTKTSVASTTRSSIYFHCSVPTPPKLLFQRTKLDPAADTTTTLRIFVRSQSCLQPASWNLRRARSSAEARR